MDTVIPRHLLSLKRALLSLLAALLLLSPQAGVAQVTITSEVSPRSGRLSDLYLFTVTVQGVRTTPPPQLEKIDDFDITLIGPRSSISIVNGSMSSKISYVYQIVPKREGELHTPQATMVIDGTAMTAPPINVSVNGQGKGAAQAPQETEALILQQSATPATVYEGQQVVHAVTMLTRIDLSEISLEEPSLDGFWSEEIESNRRGARRFNDFEYTTVGALKALYPLRSGTISIPKIRLRAKTPPERKAFDPFSMDLFSGDLFQHFFQEMELKPVGATSNEVSINVKPLPPVPDELKEFAPPVAVVGPTSLKLSYPLEAVNTGESKTISVEVTSEGNLNTLKSLPLNAPPHFKVYEEKPEVRADRRSGKLITHKIFHYSLVPLTPGLAHIPGVKLTFFNPQTGEYEVATSQDIALPVRGADLVSNATQAETPSQEPANGDADTRDEESSATPELMAYEEPTLTERFSRYVSVQLALLILAAVCGASIIVLLARPQRASPSAKTPSTDSVSSVSSINELELLVREVISSKLDSVTENSTIDELRSRVAANLNDKELSLAIRSLLDDIEVYRYSKESSQKETEIPALKERLETIISEWHS